MKRLTAVILICLVCLGGCGKKDEGNGVVQVTENNQTNREQSAVQKVKKSALSDIGTGAEEFVSLHGEPEETTWAEGPLYRFSDSAKWYTFSEYEFDGDEYFPKGSCTEAIMPLYELISTDNGEYDIDAVSRATGSKLLLSYNEIDEVPCYEISYKDYKFVIYADENGKIDENSNVNVSKRED